MKKQVNLVKRLVFIAICPRKSRLTYFKLTRYEMLPDNEGKELSFNKLLVLFNSLY